MAGANIFETGQDAFDRSYARQQKFGVDAATKRAGASLATGDYAGGAATLNQAGLIDQAHNVVADQQQLQDRQAASSAAETQRKAQALLHVTEFLKSTPPEHRQDALQAALPIFQKVGIDATPFQQLTPDQLTDQQLDAFAGAVGKVQEGFTLSEGQKRFDGHGKEVASVDPKAASFSLVPGGAHFTNGAMDASLPAAPVYREVAPGGSLVEVPGGPAPAAAPAGDPKAVAAPLLALGATVTSGIRTPEHNAAVGGVPNSDHISGQAVDLVPPKGMTLAQLGHEAQQRIPGSKVIVENDHVHVQWGPPGGAQPQAGGARVIASGGPKPMARAATVSEKAAYGIPPEVPAQIKPDGSIDVISGTGAAQKPIPPTVKTAISTNNASIAKIDNAIAALRKNGGALGYQNIFGDNVMQRVDPGGVATRAAVANIGSQIIHDRSGAAVTASETPRLLPFIPTATDNPKAAITKLQQLKANILQETAAIESGYGPDTGYRSISPASATPPAASGGGWGKATVVKH